jgi:hypothetical protein
VLLNLGVALLYGGQFEEAIGCLKTAEALIEQGQGEEKHLPYILTSQADCFLRLNRIQEGLEVARKSISSSRPPGSATETLSRIVREFNLHTAPSRG